MKIKLKDAVVMGFHIDGYNDEILFAFGYYKRRVSFNKKRKVKLTKLVGDRFHKYKIEEQ